MGCRRTTIAKKGIECAVTSSCDKASDACEIARVLVDTFHAAPAPEIVEKDYCAEHSEKLAHPTRFERVTFAFGGQRSIQLSYGCVGVHLADRAGMGNGRNGLKQPIPRQAAGNTPVRPRERSRGRPGSPNRAFCQKADVLACSVRSAHKHVARHGTGDIYGS